MAEILYGDEVLEELILPPVIVKKVPALQFQNIQEKTLPVSDVRMEDGKITSIKLTEEIDGKDEYTIDEVFFNANFLFVPGIGYLSPGTIISYENCSYVLLFGWHTNPSNQTIYSWYLANDDVCHTLYHEMINKIDLVKIC